MVRPKTGFNQKEYFKKWSLKNREKMNAYMRKYRKEHPEYVERQRKRTHKPDSYIARKEKDVENWKKYMAKKYPKKAGGKE